MFKKLFKIFKRKEYRLVAMLTANYQRKAYGAWSWSDCQTVFHCFENEAGKRWFTMSHSRPDIYESDVRKMHDYSIINGWKNHAHDLLNIPSYSAVADGAPILLRD